MTYDFIYSFIHQNIFMALDKIGVRFLGVTDFGNGVKTSVTIPKEKQEQYYTLLKEFGLLEYSFLYLEFLKLTKKKS